MSIRHLRSCCLALCLASCPVHGTRDPAGLCDDAARAAAEVTPVPLAVLLAITRVETGRGGAGGLRPWPWTINQAGNGHWFDTKAQATAAAEDAVTSGGSLDIGCFQINHHWHAANFASLEAMFDPQTNARYAAGFLSNLYDDTGAWPAAIAAYHSRRDGPAAGYLEKIEAVMADLTPTSPADRPRENSFPLLRAGAPGVGGSLVPRQSGARPLIGAAP